MEFNHTDARILKLYAKGLSLEQIARKIGRPNDVPRVKSALLKHGILLQVGMEEY